MKLELTRQIFEKYWNIKSHENSLSVEPSSSMRTDGRMKLISASRNYANAPKMAIRLV